jgi:DNA (cytosine-5)-methyltransferase 1
MASRHKKKLKAIDLYSGVGGWSLGLRLAGIEVIASYDLSGAANETNFKNNHHRVQTVDIRRLSLDELPPSVDIVVGSPPCTQFSFSNRGGNGDIEDGLKDIIKFLTVVNHLRPAAWAMENVPRVAAIIEDELGRRGRLRRFKHLISGMSVVNMEDFGVPQRRVRCIVGNLPFDLLSSYACGLQKRTLGSVVSALSSRRVRDPIYGFPLKREHLRDHVLEGPLNAEETRINRANKACHPVYNVMPFPDRLDRSVRTITATCTRVSRESVVIADSGDPVTYRRLTVRERASLQGFPLTFQFYASTYGRKLEMVGNAIPPLFSYYVAHAMKRTASKDIPKVSKLATSLSLPISLPADTNPERAGMKYPANRKFRFAIPTLRLKSGVRFELVNMPSSLCAAWAVNFYFGTSKSIHSIDLNRTLANKILQALRNPVQREVKGLLEKLANSIKDTDVERMQQVWSHRGLGRTTPFMLLDLLDGAGREMQQLLNREAPTLGLLVQEVIEEVFNSGIKQPVGVSKLVKNASTILAGFLVGAVANTLLENRTSSASIGASNARSIVTASQTSDQQSEIGGQTDVA